MLTFAHPSFLFAGFALVIPLVIHLMKRQTALKLVFPSIRFLTKGKLPNEGKHRLRDLLLLLLRLCIYAMVILTFAEPQWKTFVEAEFSPIDTVDKQAVIILDLSVSMSGWNNFDNAKKEIDSILNNGSESCALLSFSNKSIVEQEMTNDLALIRDRVNQLSPTTSRGGAIPEVIKNASALFDGEAAKTLYIISDFQLSDWGTVSLTPISKDIEVVLIDVAQNINGNIAIVGAESTRLPGDKIQVITELHNYGFVTRDTTVTLTIDGEKSQQTVTIPARRRYKVTFVQHITRAKQGVVSLGPDEYLADNQYFLWTGDKAPIRLLALLPLKEESAKQQEMFFIQKALKAITIHSSVDFILDIVDSDGFSELDLNEWDGLILAGAADYFNKTEFSKLHAFLNNGGLAFCTPGKLPSHLFLGLKSNGMGDMTFIRTEKSNRLRKIGLGWLNPECNLATLFDDVNQTDLFLLPVRKFAHVRTGEDVEVMLKMDSGAPALLRQQVGEGAIYVNTYALSMEWSDFPVSSSFLPILRAILSDPAVITQSKIKRVDCGTAIELDSTNPIGSVVYNQPQLKIVNGIPHEINISRSESVVTKQSFGAIRQMLKPGKSYETHDIYEEQEQDPQYTVQALRQYTAALLALFVLLEMVFGYWLDRKERNG